jgi:hypothetical protein
MIIFFFIGDEDILIKKLCRNLKNFFLEECFLHRKIAKKKSVRKVAKRKAKTKKRKQQRKNPLEKSLKEKRRRKIKGVLMTIPHSSSRSSGIDIPALCTFTGKTFGRQVAISKVNATTGNY